jgi:hypothetical protein
MIRLLIAAAFLTLTAASAFAHGCPRSRAGFADAHPSTVASQPTAEHAIPPPSMLADHSPS